MRLEYGAMRRFLVRACALGVAVVLLAGAAQAPDAARVLAEMRQAIGGEALDSVQGFSVKGSESRNLGFARATADGEWIYVRPDRFIHVSTNTSAFGRITDTTGFNGNALVSMHAWSGRGGSVRGGGMAGVPDRPSLPRDLDRVVMETKRAFSLFVIALLGVTPIYPYEATYVGEDVINKRPVQVLALEARDGYALRLYTDAVTHLPLAIGWMTTPHVIVYSAGERGGKTPQAAPGTILLTQAPQTDPTAGAAPVEHRIYYSDFALTAGLKWPHRMKEIVAGEVLAEIRLDRFKINPPIEPQRFVPVQRDR